MDEPGSKSVAVRGPTPAISSSPFQVLVFHRLPLVVMAAATAGALAWGTSWTEASSAVPWLIALVAVGLPHGAVDWAVSRRAWGMAPTLRMSAVYVAGMTVVLVLFAALPVPLIALFALVSVWHFGMAHADSQSPPIEGGAWRQAIAATARGGLVLGLPMSRWPAATAGIADHVVRLVTGQPAAIDSGIVKLAGIVVVGIALAAFAIEAAGAWSQPATRRRTIRTAVELAVIALLGLTTAPLFSVGLYFLCWHAWRQMELLAPLVAGFTISGPSSLARALLAIHRAALPLLMPTWLTLAAAWWLLSPHHSTGDLALLSLAAYLVVTPSHDMMMAVVRAAPAGRRSACGCNHPVTAYDPGVR